ncbi:NAD(P)/FAD-dependent oxidoreductase [Pandoraea fibrosis]|uniref:FAD-dependent oxidoreductase n=1 Tax=Pandoraea fibrosis TaxID=1891094 RepID=A0A5E4VIN5_9BURK|nr:FAD-dependent oxidoreductase [Pandoraea fibrosis]VVE11259.1 FAD-dependent oxidoreductase [Pandoraea fibrosis]
MYIVVGAGIIGASVAYFLARAGAPVTVIDAGRIAGGTSSASFAWVNSHNKPPRPYHDLNVAGMRAHATLRDQFESAPWWHSGGTLAWEGGNPQTYRAKVATLQDWGYRVRWLDHAEVSALAPDIDIGAIGDAPVAYFPDDGWVDPAVYCQALLAAACERGARLLTHTPVAGLIRRGERVVGVRTEAGEALDADTVVNCTGRWAGQPAFADVQPIPLKPSAGLMAFTPPLAHSIRRVIFSPEVHIRPDGAGRLMICRNDLDLPIDAIASQHLSDAQRLLHAASKILPLLAGVQAEALRVGVRALPADQYPAVGPTPEVPGFYSVITHSGVTLAPFLGEAVADEILHRIARPELATFRPERFRA